ncbi:hypothetical protein EJB05_10426, partial [Eragrostis curvula]
MTTYSEEALMMRSKVERAGPANLLCFPGPSPLVAVPPVLPRRQFNHQIRLAVPTPPPPAAAFRPANRRRFRGAPPRAVVIPSLATECRHPWGSTFSALVSPWWRRQRKGRRREDRGEALCTSPMDSMGENEGYGMDMRRGGGGRKAQHDLVGSPG